MGIDINSLPNNRAAAKANGSKFYLGPKACKLGHTPLRRTSSGICVECHYLLSEKSRLKNIETIRVRNRLWMKEKYYPIKKDKIILYQREYYLKNEDRVKDRNKKWAQENKDRVSENAYNSTKKRRALLKGIVGSYTKKEVMSLIEKQNGKCSICFNKLKEYHADHIIPLFLGGSNTISNIQMCCPSCNKSKGRKHPNDFMRQRGMLI